MFIVRQNNSIRRRLWLLANLIPLDRTHMIILDFGGQHLQLKSYFF